MALRTFQRITVKPGLTMADVPALIERLQDAIEAALQGMASSPTANATRMDDVSLVTGSQTIRHTLGRVPKVFPSDGRVTVGLATASTIELTAAADLVCSLLLM